MTRMNTVDDVQCEPLPKCSALCPVIYTTAPGHSSLSIGQALIHQAHIMHTSSWLVECLMNCCRASFII